MDHLVQRRADLASMAINQNTEDIEKRLPPRLALSDLKTWFGFNTPRALRQFFYSLGFNFYHIEHQCYRQELINNPRALFLGDGARELKQKLDTLYPREVFLLAIDRQQVHTLFLLAGICKMPQLMNWLGFDNYQRFNEFFSLIGVDKKQISRLCTELRMSFDGYNPPPSRWPIERTHPLYQHVFEKQITDVTFGHLSLDAGFKAFFDAHHEITSHESLDIALGKPPKTIRAKHVRQLHQQFDFYRHHLVILDETQKLLDDLRLGRLAIDDFNADRFNALDEPLRKDVLRLFFYGLPADQRIPWAYRFYPKLSVKCMYVDMIDRHFSAQGIPRFLAPAGHTRNSFTQTKKSYRESLLKQNTEYQDLPLLPNETWAPITVDGKQYPHYISDHGRIIKGYQREPIVFTETHALAVREMLPTIDHEGRPRLNISDGNGGSLTRYVSTLVGHHFVPKPSKAHTVVLSRNNLNNETRAEYLYWATHLELAALRKNKRKRTTDSTDKALAAFTPFTVSDWQAFCVQHRLFTVTEIAEHTGIPKKALYDLFVRQELDTYVLFADVCRTVQQMGVLPQALKTDAQLPPEAFIATVFKAINTQSVERLYQLALIDLKTVRGRFAYCLNSPKKHTELSGNTLRALRNEFNQLLLIGQPVPPYHEREGLVEQIKYMPGPLLEQWLNEKAFATKHDMAHHLGVKYGTVNLILNRKGYHPKRLTPFFSSKVSRAQAERSRLN